MISGASHREDPATPGVAAIVNTGFDIIGVRPYRQPGHPSRYQHVGLI